MNTNISQPTNQELTPDEAKAALGTATYLQEQLIPRQTQENAPQNAQNGEMDETGEDEKYADLEARIGEVEKSTRTAIKEEIGGIKDMIKQLLEEEKEDEKEKEDEQE